MRQLVDGGIEIHPPLLPPLLSFSSFLIPTIDTSIYLRNYRYDDYDYNSATISGMLGHVAVWQCGDLFCILRLSHSKLAFLVFSVCHFRI